ncbi:dynein intermediate chain 3, ciliary-like [Schistocerca nitens]|uniref:dynein intermediate chain 3, ciliary-like n=1 Tax=Schistocerca nitens TaxID=7011 RepID=UPI002119A917|nr:dynein intermediate chain 3, ciliary-like [Schistocerca nitens]
MNTEAAKYEEHGMNHAEGSWPKNVNPNDPEETQRYRDKQMKDESYLQSLRTICEPMEHYILQNNTVNIYDDYYGGIEFQSLDKMATARKISVFRDCSRPERPINHISWAPEGSLMAVSHCNMSFGALLKNTDTTSYIWDVVNPDTPFRKMSSSRAVTCMEFNPKDPHTLMSGLATGEVGVWDIRDGAALTLHSTLLYSHRAPVALVQVIHSKTGNEFFSTSYDGQVLWWDMRTLSEPTEKLILDPEKGEQDISRASGASFLEYEPTIPTQFMVGTQMGEVIACNRKMKTPAEMIVAKYAAHKGPVVALHRNQALLKNFLTVGDWSAKIWVGECKTSSILWTKYHHVRLTGGYWSPTRFSVFFTTKGDGTLDVWDVLKSNSDPYLTVKVCDEALTCLRVHDEGLHVAVGNSLGTVNLIELSENLADAPKKERGILATMLERECHREKILDAKVREQKLKQKLKGREDESRMLVGAATTAAEEARVEKSEKKFFEIIDTVNIYLSHLSA